MARTGRPKAALVLAEDERAQLLRWSRRAKSAQSLALRSRIVLACADGLDNTQVAARLEVVPATVGKWRRRFVDRRLDGLLDEPRPGGPRSVSDEQVEAVIVATLERTPKDATHWSRASMAADSGLSRSTIGRIWKAFSLKPHLVDTFKLSNDPQFIAKVRDVVGLYLDPPERALVLCVDEKSGIQALDRSAPVLPMMPGMPERRTHDYVRAGVTTLFAALDVASGQVIGSLHRRHRAIEFKKFLATIDSTVCVASFGVRSSVATMTASTCASLTLRGPPGRGTSRTFAMNWGSVLSLKVSTRCGFRLNAFQIRPIVERDRPLSAAIDARDQGIFRDVAAGL